MKINELVATIPGMVAGIFEDIYIINKSSDEAYHVQYTGDKLRVSSVLPYEKFSQYIALYDNKLLKSIEECDELKQIITLKEKQDDKLLISKSIDEYKMVMIIDVTLPKKDLAEKPILLIADDSPIITKFFKKTFEEEYEILVANNGREAIDLVEKYRNDALVGAFFDLQMPIMDGYAVLDYFKENNLFVSIPVSVISGEDSADGISRATAYGIVDMLQKPFNAEAARAIVAKTIRFSPKIN